MRRTRLAVQTVWTGARHTNTHTLNLEKERTRPIVVLLISVLRRYDFDQSASARIRNHMCTLLPVNNS